MYSPKIDPDLVRRLYHERVRQQRPMTQLVNEAVLRYLQQVEVENSASAEPVEETCVSEIEARETKSV